MIAGRDISPAKSIFTLILVLSIFPFRIGNAVAGDQADNPGSVKIGGVCNKTDHFYHSLTSTRIPWKVNELYAVPTGTNDPLTWGQYSSFKTQLLQALQPPEDAAAFAQACGSIWQSFFSGKADVLITLGREVTGTDDVLQCQSGVWVFTSTQNTDQTDISEWLQVGSFDVTSDASTAALQQLIQSLLDQLNSQPGAQPASD